MKPTAGAEVAEVFTEPVPGAPPGR